MHNSRILSIANSSQQKAIKHPPAPLMVIAGAGTGKTFTLENRIVYLIENYNVSPENIIKAIFISTFASIFTFLFTINLLN